MHLKHTVVVFHYSDRNFDGSLDILDSIFLNDFDVIQCGIFKRGSLEIC